ncbi:MAG: hypothetical protein AB1696_19330 [Planctomycetota bacterium]
MSKKHGRNGSYPDVLIGEDGEPTHPLWHEYPEGKGKPCKAMKIIQESERLAVHGWPYRYQVPPVMREHFTPVLRGFAMLWLAMEQKRSMGRECAAFVASLPQLSLDDARMLVVADRPKRMEPPWDRNSPKAQQLDDCLSWLDRNISTFPDGHVRHRIVRPVPLALLASLHPQLLCDEQGEPRLCKVLPRGLFPWGSEQIEQDAFEMALDHRIAEAGALLRSIVNVKGPITWPKLIESAEAKRKWLGGGEEAAKGGVAKDGQKKRRNRQPFTKKTRPLTDKQTEAMQIVGECKGSIAAAAKRLGRDHKTVRQHYDAALKKMGKKAVNHLIKKQRLPTDRRGQVNV